MDLPFKLAFFLRGKEDLLIIPDTNTFHINRFSSSWVNSFFLQESGRETF